MHQQYDLVLEVFSNNDYLVPYFLNVSYFIEDIFVFLKIVSFNIIVSAVCDDINPIAFPCELLT